MRQGGNILAEARRTLVYAVKPGITLAELDLLAETLISKAGAAPSFKMVPGYQHATCITVNEGVVHGIPNGRKIKEGDVVSIDIGVFYKGFHTDAATTLVAGKVSGSDRKFLTIGRKALEKAIAQARAGNRVGHISRAIQETVESKGYCCIRSLTGHGVGTSLHESPMIPCFQNGAIKDTQALVSGQTLAIEIIYTQGSHEVVTADDGWTVLMKDKMKSGLFEETVLVTDNEPEVLTNG